MTMPTKLLRSIKLTLITIFFFNVLNCGQDKYTIKKITPQPSLNGFNRDFTGDIQSSKIFSESLINSYFEFVRREVNPAFHDSFRLNKKSGQVSVKAIFSSAKESLLYIYPSENDEMTVDCIRYPIQMSVFSGLGLGKGVDLKVPYEEALQEYEKSTTLFGFGEDNLLLYISRVSFSIPFPRLVRFSKQSLMIFHEVTVNFQGPDGKEIPIYFSDVSVFTGEKDFSWAIDKAKEIGQTVAFDELRILFESSEFFRASLADVRLRPKAEVIQQKISRAQKDSSFNYPPWEFKMDVAQLKQEAQMLGVDASYVDELFKDISSKQRDGVLLWYYPNQQWFIIQWVLINLLTLLLLFILSMKKLFLKRMPVSLHKKIVLISTSVVVIINSWVFTQRPQNLELKYWIVPGILFLTCCIFVFFLQDKSDKSKKKSAKD